MKKLSIYKLTIQPEYWLIKYVWLIIILPKSLQLLCYFCIGIMLFRNKTKIILDPISGSILGVFLIQVTSIFYNTLIREQEVNRLLAVGNTCMLWFLAFVLYSYYSQKTIDIKKIGKYTAVNIVILFSLNLFSLYLYYIKGVTNYQVFGKTLHTVIYLNKLPMIRFIGLNDYSNLVIEFLLINFPLSLFYTSSLKKIWRFFLYLAVLIITISVHSRSGLVLWGIGSVYYFFNQHTNKKLIFKLSIFWCGGMLAIMNYSAIQSVFANYILYGNISSNNLRLRIYLESLREVFTLSPILGMGIKREFVGGYLLGSHSTYIGLVYKCGLVGGLLGIYLFITCIKRHLKSIRCNNEMKLIAFFFLLLMTVFAIEDIDGANWLILLFFVVEGMATYHSNEGAI